MRQTYYNIENGKMQEAEDKKLQLMRGAELTSPFAPSSIYEAAPTEVR